MNRSSGRGTEIWGIIITLAVNCAPSLDCANKDGKPAVGTASDDMVMGAVRALCEYPVLDSQPNHSDCSLTALDVVLKQVDQK